MPNDRYMARYWHGGTDKDRVRELCEELTSILGGVTYTQVCVTSAGKEYKKLVFEYESSTNN
tara:strand:- start:5499 stop:5684 length:186 start_codon:yes stop_codon:yes gene_type:complete